MRALACQNDLHSPFKAKPYKVFKPGFKCMITHIPILLQAPLKIKKQIKVPKELDHLETRKKDPDLKNVSVF